MRHSVAIFLALASPAAAGDVCLRQPYDLAVSRQEQAIAGLLAELHPVLERFPSLAGALEALSPALCLSDETGGSEGYLDPERNGIFLRSDLPRGLQLGILLHELRHLDQLGRGLCPSDDLSMTEYGRGTFAIEADASAVSLLVAWTLKQSGRPAAWDALAAWPLQADIAARFAGEMSRTGNPAGAAGAAFDQWYASEVRRETYYIASCSDYLDRQDEAHRAPRYGRVADDFLARLCRLPDGRAYPCAERGAGRR